MRHPLPTPTKTDIGNPSKEVANTIQKSINLTMRGTIHSATVLPDVQELIAEDTLTMHVPMYHVVLLDDDEHTYDYVIEMLGAVFGHSIQKAYDMACQVDANGRVIVDTTHLDRAELKRDQIHDFGADWRMPNSKGGMSARIEPAP